MSEKRFWGGAIVAVACAVAGASALPALLLRPASEVSAIASNPPAVATVPVVVAPQPEVAAPLPDPIPALVIAAPQPDLQAEPPAQLSTPMVAVLPPEPAPPAPEPATEPSPESPPAAPVQTAARPESVVQPPDPIIFPPVQPVGVATVDPLAAAAAAADKPAGVPQRATKKASSAEKRQRVTRQHAVRPEPIRSTNSSPGAADRALGPGSGLA